MELKLRDILCLLDNEEKIPLTERLRKTTDEYRKKKEIEFQEKLERSVLNHINRIVTETKEAAQSGEYYIRYNVDNNELGIATAEFIEEWAEQSGFKVVQQKNRYNIMIELSWGDTY